MLIPNILTKMKVKSVALLEEAPDSLIVITFIGLKQGLAYLKYPTEKYGHYSLIVYDIFD